MNIQEQAENASQRHNYIIESERQAFVKGFVEAKTIDVNRNNGENEINTMLLHINIKGYLTGCRYSDNENTDNVGRWARILYYNGLQIAWISGLAKNESGKFEHRTIGKAAFFVVHLDFPVSGQGNGGHKSFDNYESAENYAKDMFDSFKKFIHV